MSDELEKLVKQIKAAGDDAANAEYEYRQLRDDTKSLLAVIQGTYIEEGGSEAKAARLALANDDYRAYLKRVNEAWRNSERAAIRYRSLMALLDVRRSLLAMEREKLAKGVTHIGG